MLIQGNWERAQMKGSDLFLLYFYFRLSSLSLLPLRPQIKKLGICTIITGTRGPGKGSCLERPSQRSSWAMAGDMKRVNT